MRDKDVRRAVRHRLRCEHDGDPDTRIVEEMGIWNGAVRVDVAVINGELAGYEIKSAQDTLERLPNQAALYSMVFERLYLVAADKHLDKASAAIPRWWGMISARTNGNAVELSTVRSSERNPSRDSLQLARLLWREETTSLLESRSALKGFRSASRERLSARLAEVFEPDNLADEVRRCLKNRETWLRQSICD